MTASKTYATNRELGLNSNGVRVPYQHRGAIQPMAEGSALMSSTTRGLFKPEGGKRPGGSTAMSLVTSVALT